MEAVSIPKFKATCRELLEGVWSTGEPIVVTRRRESSTKVVPFAKAERGLSWLGALRGSGKIVGDVVAPASEESEWEPVGA
jgi:antitoxin (DNA-binding transcriptional repressor) of toxin-antitoxin stability system